MKKTINGLTYNTETAALIGSDSYNGSCTDFQSWEENLYVTSKGNYFLQGSGGPMSKYSTPIGNNGRGGGSDIIPLSKEDALAWAEEHDQDAVEHFVDMVEEA